MSRNFRSSFRGTRFAFLGVAALLALPMACASSGTEPRSPVDEPTSAEEPDEGMLEPLVGAKESRTPLQHGSSESETSEGDEVSATVATEEPLVPAKIYGVKGKEIVPGAAPPKGAAMPSAPAEGVPADALDTAASSSGSTHFADGVGAGFGSGHGRLGGSHKSLSRKPKIRMGATTVTGRPAPAPRQRRTGVAAGEWDDNANFREFNQYLSTQNSIPFEKVDVSKRRFLVVKDRAGKPVPNCIVTVMDGIRHKTSLTTGASGRAVLFPRAEGLVRDHLKAKTSCQGATASAQFSTKKDDGVVTLTLKKKRDSMKHKTVDVVFILDTTGSMSEEIRQLKGTITKVADTLGESGARIRLGIVEYRDRGDVFLTRVHQMTTDVDGFVARVETVRANGGGDTPEDVNEGIAAALSHLNWNEHSVARTAFLIGDAPPQLNYQDSISYAHSMKEAARRGIHLYTIAASGMDSLGQVIWRQIAQYTGGTNLFVLRGGAGPASVGGGDPQSSCGGTHTNYSTGNLSELIRGKIRLELATLDADPLKIPGLQRDEKAKPCDQRIVLAQQNQ